MIFYNLFEALKQRIEAISIAGESPKVYLSIPEKKEELARLSILLEFITPEDGESIKTLGGGIQEIELAIRLSYTMPNVRDRRDLQKLELVRTAVYYDLVQKGAGLMLSDVPGFEGLLDTEDDQGLTGNFSRSGINFAPKFSETRYAVEEIYTIIYRDDSGVKIMVEKSDVDPVVVRP